MFRVVEMSAFHSRVTESPSTTASHVGLGMGENESWSYLTARVFGLLI